MLKTRLSVLAVCALNMYAAGAPDLVCSEIVGASSFGVVDGVAAYSFGTTICNHGDSAAEWDGASDAHPLISQSIYKLKDHQITQIGIGFVRHTTVPLSSNACGLGCTPAGIMALGAGCSDTSASSVNGAQGLMGPRTEVNALTGDYPYPFTSINQTGDAVYKRLQVPLADVSDPDALYFVETQIVGIDESGFDAVLNNFAYRQVTFTPGSATASLVGPTYSGPAIYAWRDHGGGIGVPDDGVMMSVIAMPDSEEYIIVGSHEEELSEELWRYDYAVLNLNGERGVRRANIPLCNPSKKVLTSSSHAPNYHDDLDGLIVNTPWNIVISDKIGSYAWEAEEYITNPHSNAIRWGAMHQFSATMTTGGSSGSSILFLGLTDGITPDPYDVFGASAHGPAVCEYFCGPDINSDLILDFFDVSLFLQTQPDYNGDTQFDFFDVSAFLQDFAAGCSF
jgi:hypothetical protein